MLILETKGCLCPAAPGGQLGSGGTQRSAGCLRAGDDGHCHVWSPEQSVTLRALISCMSLVWLCGTQRDGGKRSTAQSRLIRLLAERSPCSHRRNLLWSRTRPGSALAWAVLGSSATCQCTGQVLFASVSP